jgi:hypothetical protein
MRAEALRKGALAMNLRMGEHPLPGIGHRYDIELARAASASSLCSPPVDVG